MPSTDDDGAPISTRIARRPNGGDFPPIGEREPFARHVFFGGNTLLLQLLRDEPALGAVAGEAAFNDAIAGTRGTLADAARVAVSDPVVDGDVSTFAVRVDNLTGHKLPTGYPSRRVVLHVRALDDDGHVLLESGRVDADGAVVDAAGGRHAEEVANGPVRAHVDVVDSDAVALVYEAVLGDGDGVPTTRLLATAQRLKDNRVLPLGFDADSVDGRRVAAVGVADDDFGAGVDVVDVEVHGDVARLDVELLYQTLPARWRDELVATDTEAARALDAMLQRSGAVVEVMARASWSRAP